MHFSSFKKVSPIEWPRSKAQLIHFVRKYSGRTLTKHTLRCLSSLTAEQLLLPGNSIVTATIRGQEGAELIGLSFVADYGEAACILAIHPLYRGNGLGAQLLSAQLNEEGQTSCRIVSNMSLPIPSLKTELQANELSHRPAGRPALKLKTARRPHQRLEKQEGEAICLRLC